MGRELYHHGIKGMRWGVRRYQNEDGSLTEAGKKRYAKDILQNNRKKRKDRLDEDALNDPKRWVREDLERKQQFVNTSASLVRQMQHMERESRTAPTKVRMDLSNMTEQEMRQRINRELTERQYNDLFGTKPETVDKGREYLAKTLEVAGGVLAVSSSALSIALAIKQLKE